MSAERPPGEADAYARLEGRLRQVDLRACDGCTDCATRCVDGIEMSYPEFARLLAGTRRLPPARLHRVLAQDKRLVLWEHVTAALCPFLDTDVLQCVVYDARPLICRLFGVVFWLPCPQERAPSLLADAPALMQEYSALERHTLREWLQRTSVAMPGLDAREAARPE